MAKLSDSMARWYASVNDDVRHHVVERGWYQQQQRDDPMSRDVAQTVDHSQDYPEPPQQFAQLYGRDAAIPDDLEPERDFESEARGLYGEDAAQPGFGADRDGWAGAPDPYQRPEIEQDR